MSNNIELLSNTENFTIGTNSNLSEILANVVKVGTDTSNVTISIPQDISSSYNLILPVRQGASGESLVYGADGQLKWHDTTVLKQVVSVYGDTLTGNLISTTGTHDSPTYLDAYTANITPMADNSKIFVQFKVNYHAALSASNQISFFIKKTYDGNENTFTESLFGPYNAAGGFTGQYISNLVDEALTSNSISYQLGYKINGTVDVSDTLGILGYDASYNNTIVLQEFEGSGSNATSVWNKGSDSNGLYYNDGTVHIGSTKDALGSQNTSGVALELSGNLVGTNANFSGEVTANVIRANEGYFSSNTLYINNKPVLNEDAAGNRTVNTDVIISDASNGLTIKAISDNGNIILDPSGTGAIQLNGDVQLSGGNINAETFIGDLSGNVSAITMAATTTTTNNLSLDGTLTTSNSSRVVGNLIPSVDDTYSLGAPDRVWKDVYIGPGSLYLNGTKILDDSSDTINMRTDRDQALNIQTSGTGTLTLRSDTVTQINSGNTSSSPAQPGSIILNANGGSIKIQSDLVLEGGTISMSQIGATAVPINLNDDVDVDGNLKVNDISRKNPNYGVNIEDVSIDGSSITGNVTGHVTGTVSSLSNLDTDHLTEGSTNKYYTNTKVVNQINSHLSGGTGVTYSNGSISIGQSVGTSDNVQFNNVTIDGTLNSDDITGSNVTVSNDLVVSGNLTVNGTRTIVNATTLDIGDNKIVVNATGSTTDAGIIANVSGTEHEFVYSTNNNAWGTTGDLNIGGNVTGTTFIGNLIGAITMNGHIIPLIGNTFDIGSPDRQIRDIYVSNNTIYFGEDATLSVDETTRELKVRKRNKDVIPKAIRDANPSITNDDILTATFGAGHGKQLSDLTLGHYRRYARINLTIGGKSSDNIEISDIFTNDAENWEEDISLETLNNTLTQIQENMNISGNLTIGGNITSTSGYFIGDGSQLTGISAGGASELNDLTDAYKDTTNLVLGSTLTRSEDCNTIVGVYAGGTITTGQRCTYIGHACGRYNTASFCVAMGRETLRNGDGNHNTAIGYVSSCLASGSENTTLGSHTLYSGTGSRNVAIGYYALRGDNINGNDNTVIGYCAHGQSPSGGLSMTGSNNIVIGANTQASSTSVSNEITLGNSNNTLFRMPGLGGSNGYVLTYNNGYIEFANINNHEKEVCPYTFFRYHDGGVSWARVGLMSTSNRPNIYSNTRALTFWDTRNWVSFPTFTGTHICFGNFNSTDIGLIVSANGKFINQDNSLKPSIEESLPILELSNKNNDKKVFGVINKKETGDREYRIGSTIFPFTKENNNEYRFIINSLGEGAIWVCNKNGILENGDYITTSNIIGYGEKQNDDLLHNYTVAKITNDCNFSLTKKIKQKLKIEVLQDNSGISYKNIIYANNNEFQYENELDELGNIIYEYEYDTRFLDENANILSGEQEYLSRLNNGENVYIACFVGCTYHCG